MSFVEGNISVGIQLAPGTLDRLRANLTALERGINLRVNLNPTPINEGRRAIDDLNNSAQRASATISQKLGGAAKAVGTTIAALGAAGGAGLVALGTKAIMAGKEFNVLQQQVRAGLTAVLGTTKAAEDLLASVNELNNTSPFPRSTFLAATQQLVGFGIEAGKVTGILDSVQEAVAGIGGGKEDIDTFTRAFAQIKAQGKLTGDVLFTLGNKGVNAAKIIGDQMGRTGQEIKDSVSRGTIDADKAIDLLTKGLKEKFDGSVENVGQSFIGAMDRVQARLRDIGSELTKVFINPTGGGAAVDGLNNLAVGLRNIKDIVVPVLIPGITKLADVFVRATKAFSDFTAGIKTEQVQKFLDIFRMLSPLIALVGTNLVKAVGQGIPGIRVFTGALSGPVLALTLLAASVPEVRDAILEMAEALRPAVEELLPALTELLQKAADSGSSLAPILTTLASLATVFVSAVTPLLSLLKFGPVQAALLAVAIKFALVRIAGTQAFAQIGYAALQASVKIQNAALATGAAAGSLTRLQTAGVVGRAALSGVGAALGSIITPANLAIAAIAIVLNKMATMKRIASEAAAATRQALGENLDVEEVDEFDIGVKRTNKTIDELTDKLAHVDSFGERLKGAFDPAGGFGIFGPTNNEKAIKQTEASLKEAQKFAEELAAKGAIKQNVITDAMAATGKTAQEVAAKAKELGLRLTEIKGDQVANSVKKIKKAFDEMIVPTESAVEKLKNTLQTQADALDKVRSAADSLKSSEKALADLRRVTSQELKDNITRAELGLVSARMAVGAAADRVKQSEIGLAQAKRGVADAERSLNDLTTERNHLLADTTREARELAEAESGLAKTKQELIDLDQREAELNREKADFALNGDKLAAADRAILRAKIALNNATREEKELQDELNKSQSTGVDFTGLSVAQIKEKLAGVRAELAAKRATRKTDKTAQQIEDETLTAKLNKVDAEQALKDATKARTDLEIDQGIAIRENEEALKGLQLDKESSLRRQTEQQIALGILKTGDTETARTLKQLDLDIIVATEGITTAALTLKGAEREVETAIIDQKTAVIAVRDATRDIETAVRNSKTHYDDIKAAQQKVKEDGQKYREAVAFALDDNRAINAALVERIGLNSTLLGQNPKIVDNIVNQLLGPAIFGPFLPGSPQEKAQAARNTNASKLTDILKNHPDQLLKFLQGLGLQLAEGAVINKETFATIGEAGREVVLPLTRPARLAELLAHSQVLPPVLAALGRISLPSQGKKPGRMGTQTNVLSPSTGVRPLGVSRGNNVVVRRADGPMTYGQADAIIALLAANGQAQVTVEAPINVYSQIDEEMLMRKITSRLERKIYDILSRR